jgi:signal transduction histidine kinase
MIYSDSGFPVDYRIINVNRSFEKYTGIPAEKARGASARELYGHDPPPYIAEYDRVVQDGNSSFFETYYEGMKKNFSISVISPRPGHFATIFLDITGRKQLEAETVRLLENSERSREALLSILEDQLNAQEALRESEQDVKRLNEELEQRVMIRTAQLESTNLELESFSYSVSHDLRAPLRHISGYADLLARRFHDFLPDQGKHFLVSIVDSAHQMGLIIDDLLQFSRAGRQELQLSRTDMNTILQDALKVIKPETKGRHIEWIHAPLPLVFGDQNLLILVWINLLSNAVKFTKAQKLARIETGFKKEKKEYIFFIQDNGPGFDMQYADKLFGVFQRLHSAQEFEGTGIGLASVRRIIAKHGGRTWAEAELNKGAKFYFTLPVTQ